MKKLSDRTGEYRQRQHPADPISSLIRRECTATAASQNRRVRPSRFHRLGSRDLLISLTIILLTPILLVTSVYSDSSANDGWTLIWSDEFIGPAGQSPDAANWGYDIGTGWGNAQLEYDTDRPTNVSLDGNGNLAIIAREESYNGQPYTSARIVTRDLFEPTYGRIEARIKMPVGQGIWPAFWLLGNDIEYNGWPQCGEVDIMEYLGHLPNVAFGSLHGPGYSFSQPYYLPSGQFDSAFHVFAVEWEETEIRWYVDGVLYETVRSEDVGSAEWVFDHPFYIILNVAVGGIWPGYPDGTTVFPQTMLIDYVRAYQSGASSETCCLTRGDINHSGFGPDIADLVFLTTYMFQDGPPPPCASEADINGSGDGPDISDLVYLVTYMFQGGEALVECPTPAVYVFDDNFGSSVGYQAFAGSKLDAVQIDETTAYAGSRSLKITVPDAGDPSGSFSGGAFVAGTLYDLTTYNAVTFYARASIAATLDITGLGNNNTGTSIYTVDAYDLTLTTEWQKYVIPIPLAAKLDAESGLFYFAEGPENGLGYDIWIDEIFFENLASITNPRPALTSRTIDLQTGQSSPGEYGTVVFSIDGTDLEVSAMPAYFDYAASNETVALVASDGSITAVGTGTATVTADLGTTPASGQITVNVTVPQGAPGSVAPTPALDASDVISLFSDVYSNHPVDTWSAPWDMADVEDYAIGADNLKKYTNLVFAGIEFTSNTIDASTMTHFHIDVWTPDATSGSAPFKVKLVDFGANGVYDGGGDDVEHEITFDENTINTGTWVSIDVPLSDFVNLTTKEHLAQLIISGDINTVFVDNILLHR